MRNRTKSLVVVASIIALISAPGAANAATGQGTAPRDDVRTVRTAISQHPDSGARSQLNALLDTRVAEGAHEAHLEVSGYTPVDETSTPATSPEASSAAEVIPADCTLSVLLTHTPGRMSVDMVTSCTSTAWQRNDMQVRVSGTNPLNPLDSKTLADESSYAGGPGLSATASTFYVCANQNATHMSGYGKSTLTIGTGKYESSAYDDIPFAGCGW